jgi:hypothetical protein
MPRKNSTANDKCWRQHFLLVAIADIKKPMLRVELLHISCIDKLYDNFVMIREEVQIPAP